MGVRTAEGETVGVVPREEADSIVIATSGMTSMYHIPKDKVAEFNGAEVILSMNVNDLGPYKESPK